MNYHYVQLRRPVTDETRNFVIEDIPEISMIPDEERPAVSRALAKVPKDRWPSCRSRTPSRRAA